jgi:hypothetical protein
MEMQRRKFNLDTVKLDGERGVSVSQAARDLNRKARVAAKPLGVQSRHLVDRVDEPIRL